MPHEVIMPALGMAQDTGVLVAWHKAPGDPVKAMDILMEVETEKSTMEVEAGFDGYVTELRVAEGEEAPVGGVIAVISDSPDDAKSAPKSPRESGPEPQPEAGDQQAEPTAKAAAPGADAKAEDSKPDGGEAAPRKLANGAAPGSAPASEQSGRILASPKAKRLARERGLDLRSLVQQGIPQPYHVADLDRIQPTAAAASVGMAAGASADRAHLSARIAPLAFQEFLAWAAEEADAPPSAAAVWASFAAGAFRRASGRGQDPLEVRVTRAGPGGSTTVYRDPDLARLGRLLPQQDDGGHTPDLILRDLSATRLEGARLPGDGAAPLLTVGRGDGDTLALALEFTPGALDADAAVALLDDLARRAESPLRHLL